MVGQPFDVLLDARGVNVLNGVHDFRVKDSRLFVEQPAIGRLLSQRMPEREFDVGKETAFEKEIGGLQMGQQVLKCVARLFGDNLKQGKRDIAADHRSHLQKPLVFRAQSVDPCGKDGLDGGRNAQCIRLPDQCV